MAEKREALWHKVKTLLGHRIHESLADAVLKLKEGTLPCEFMEDCLSNKLHLDCDSLLGKNQIHFLQLAQNEKSITEHAVLQVLDCKESWRIVHPICWHEDERAIANFYEELFEMKVAKASLVAEEVKMIYNPWSSPCSLNIELEVQKTLEVIRSKSYTEEGQANKLNCSPLQYMVWENLSETKATNASSMAEQVKLMDSPWSTLCRLQAELKLHEALEVICINPSTEEGLANKLSYSPLEYIEITSKNIPTLPEDPYEKARAIFSDGFVAEKSPKMRLVVWQPPLPSWIKVNPDGLSKGNPGLSACGGVFRSDSCDFLGGFAVALGTQSAYYAELMAVFVAVHIAHFKGWLQLWIESDCLIVVQAIQNRKLNPPKELKNIWNYCLQKMESMNIYCSHIFREGNNVADMLANLGLKYPRLQWWDHPPMEIQELLLHDFWGLPNYRVC